MATLKSCPFCGGTAELKETNYYGDRGVVIKCKKCLARINPVMIGVPLINPITRQVMDNTIYTREQAIELATAAWNHRV